MITTNYNRGIDLSNSTDIIADSISIIEDGKIVDIKDRLVNWVSGDSTAKNTISTGEGILTIAMPTGDRAFENVITVNGPNITGEEGVANFRKNVIMWGNLQVDGAISVGQGVNLLTTASGYTKEQMNSTFNALNGTVSDIEPVSIPDLIIIPKADKETTYTKTEVDAILAQKANDETTYNKTEVDAILAQKANDETTYNKDEIDSLFIASDEISYSKTQVDSFFIRSDPYLVQEPLLKNFVPDPDRAEGNKIELSLSSTLTDQIDSKEPKFHTPGPILKSLNFETGAIDLILSDAFLSNIDLKLDESQVQTMLETQVQTIVETSINTAGYQPKLISNSTTGRNLLRPDGITLLAIDEGQFIKITPTFAFINNVPSDFHLVIGLTNDCANQIINATSNIATLQTQIAAIQNPFWIAARISVTGLVVFNRGRQSITNVSNASNDIMYDITFPAHPNGDAAIVILSGCEYFNFYRNQTATSVRVYTRTGNNTPTAGSTGEFNIMIQ